MEALQAALFQMFFDHVKSIGDSRWWSESARWYELVRCILVQFDDSGKEMADEALALFGDTGLLDIDRLRNGQAIEQIARFDAWRMQATNELKTVGFSEEAARNATSTIAAVAQCLNERYEGNIQLYVRRHGQVMVDEFSQTVGIDDQNRSRLKWALILWLQSCFSMPLSLIRPSLLQFCQIVGKTPEEVMHAADEVDLNLALVDDVIDQCMSQYSADEIRDRYFTASAKKQTEQ